MGQVLRCYVEKKPQFDGEARSLLAELRDILGVKALTGLRIWKRYDIQGMERAAFDAVRSIVFSEPQVDNFYEVMPPAPEGAHTLLAVEALPGQYDQRADSCAQCIQLLTGGERPLAATATIYVLEGDLSDRDTERLRGYLINPVECREAAMTLPETLEQPAPPPAPVRALAGFCALEEAGLEKLLTEQGLAMDLADLRLFQAYFRAEGREPTVTELRVVDTYWSDHCRHTTFSTRLAVAEPDDPRVRAAYAQYKAVREECFGPEGALGRPETLMDLATIGARTLKKRGLLPDLDESEEVNACSVRVEAVVDGAVEPWLLMFKNETHNHPTEIEPFGGAATCVGGAIRDPLSGRAYVYQAMRLSGCGDVREPLAATLPGKLPQRKLARTAAAGYSAYGNQIGLATGLVSEFYHPGYRAKHMELGAVVGAAPAENVVRARPAPGDQIVLLGGRTGRDGIGGATGSSKTHNLESLSEMAGEVQKGNAPEERKIQRLFRDGEVARLIKRCNDFGAGGVAVAIGELADGLAIDLDRVPRKYDGLDGTELAISESQERMAVVLAPGDLPAFLAAAERENLEATVVAEVTASPRMVMRWRGAVIADLSREFLNSNGAQKCAAVRVAPPADPRVEAEPFSLREMAARLTLGAQRGLAERFDPSIGASSVLMPFGGRTQRTPTQVMAALLPVSPGSQTETCSVMAWGFDPARMERDCFGGAAAGVTESLAKLVAAGCDPARAHLSFQEYFPRPGEDPARWGMPFAALLGALEAQMGLGVAAIGGKDSMSGTFLDLDVPPTLVSFAVTAAKAAQILSPELKGAGYPVCLFSAPAGDYPAQAATWRRVHDLCRAGQIRAAWAVGAGGIAHGIMNMSFGNEIGFCEADGIEPALWARDLPGAIVAECTQPVEGARLLGHTTAEPVVVLGGERAAISELLAISEGVLEEVYPTGTGASGVVETVSYTGRSPIVSGRKFAAPRAVIPVFPGTNCEYDTAAACLRAGIEPEILPVRNLSAEALAQSARAMEEALGRSQILILPGGFSGGDEPDGSAKFICSFFRNPRLRDAVHRLLREQDGLALGICNGFQALIKLGLVPYGEIRAVDESCPTLTFNEIGRHQSRYVTTRVGSVHSPWMLRSEVGDLHAVPVSHGEGRFVCPPDLARALAEAGQIATQYTDARGLPSMNIEVNPNGSFRAVEGLFSPDGRVFGKMAHSERRGEWVAKNISGEKHQPIFESGALYFK